MVYTRKKENKRKEKGKRGLFNQTVLCNYDES